MVKIICALAMLITVNIQACWIIDYPAHTELWPTTTITVNGTSAVDGAYYVSIPATIEVTTAKIKGAAPTYTELLLMHSTTDTSGYFMTRTWSPPVGVTAPLFGRHIVNPASGGSNRIWHYRIREWQGVYYRDTVITVISNDITRIQEITP